MFKCAVNLMPSCAAFSADEQIGGSVGQRVKHSIIRGADHAAQVGLRGLSRIKLRAVVIKSRAFMSQTASFPYDTINMRQNPALRILSFRTRRKTGRFSFRLRNGNEWPRRPEEQRNIRISMGIRKLQRFQKLGLVAGAGFEPATFRL